jgi:hypothetical protein
VTFFGKRLSPNGWKVNPCDLLNVEDCEEILKFYETIYANPPSNGDYFGIFLKGWLAERKNYCINWALYAFDNNHDQMKRAKRPPSATSKGTSWGTFSSCQGDDCNDEVCVFEGCFAVSVSSLRVLKWRMRISLFKK